LKLSKEGIYGGEGEFHGHPLEEKSFINLEGPVSTRETMWRRIMSPLITITERSCEGKKTPDIVEKRIRTNHPKSQRKKHWHQ